MEKRSRRKSRKEPRRESRSSRVAGSSSRSEEKTIPGSYITILQPTVKPADLLTTVLKGFKPTFTYGTIFIGFAVDRVPDEKANELRLDPRVLKVVENKVVKTLSKELLIETLQTRYTVVNRDTGELYDVRELDGTAPYRYSILPHNMRVPSKARQLLGINEKPTRVPSKVAKVMGHMSEVQNVHDRAGAISGKAAKMLGITPIRKANSVQDGTHWRENGALNRSSAQNTNRRASADDSRSASNRRPLEVRSAARAASNHSPYSADASTNGSINGSAPDSVSSSRHGDSSSAINDTAANTSYNAGKGATSRQQQQQQHSSERGNIAYIYSGGEEKDSRANSNSRENDDWSFQHEHTTAEEKDDDYSVDDDHRIPSDSVYHDAIMPLPTPPPSKSKQHNTADFTHASAASASSTVAPSEEGYSSHTTNSTSRNNAHGSSNARENDSSSNNKIMSTMSSSSHHSASEDSSVPPATWRKHSRANSGNVPQDL